MAAKVIGVKVICIQHGTFHADFEMNERDGCVSDVNIVRTDKDKEIIKSSPNNSHFYVIPDFFLPKLCINMEDGLGQRKKILLVGEGFHILDSDFNDRLIRELRIIEQDLLFYGYDVIFRPHPSEKSFVKKYGFQAIDSCSLSATLSNIDVVIGYSSTVLLESASVGIPTYQISVDDAYRCGLSRDGVDIIQYSQVKQISDVLHKGSLLARRESNSRRIKGCFEASKIIYSLIK